jgi:hypothetical protein
MERRVAAKMGGKRAVCSGNQEPDMTDITGVTIQGERCTVSCKLRRAIAVWSWFRECKRNALAVNGTPILVLKEKGKEGELVVLDLCDFLRLVDSAEGGGSDGGVA